MKYRTSSEWSTALVWALAWQCLLMVQHASTQDLHLGNDFMNLECERLPVETCAFAVGAGGFRCVLETAVHVDGSIAYECQTLRLELQPGSNANRWGLQLGIDGKPFFPGAYIETDECIKACGLQRLTVGISTDDILYNNGLPEILCSPKCHQRCPNIIAHYDVIMADAGKDLTKVCEDYMEYLHAEKEQAKQPASRTGLRKGNQMLHEQAPGPNSFEEPPGESSH